MVRHIVCFGDSNTHGYRAAPDSGGKVLRFDEKERWTALLQKRLGSEYLICEEGLTGRTTAFDDPMRESMNGLSSLYSCLMSHEPVDLLIMMLGTNDIKERFEAGPEQIAAGMEQLVEKAKRLPAWRTKPNILIISPPCVKREYHVSYFEKSSRLAELYAAVAKRHGCGFLDAELIAEFNTIDHMHLTKEGHEAMANALAERIPKILSV